MRKKAKGNSYYGSFDLTSFKQLLYEASSIDLSGLSSLSSVVKHFDGVDYHSILTLIVLCDANELVVLARRATVTVCHSSHEGFLCIATASRIIWKVLHYDI